MADKYLNQIINKYEKELGFWKNFSENIETFNSEAKTTVISDYEVLNRIARMENKLDIMRTFASLSDGEYSIKISKYFQVHCSEHRLGFGLTDEIEDVVYNYVYDSHSELYVLVNKRLIPFLSPVLDYQNWFGKGGSFSLEDTMNCFNWINEKSKYDLAKYPRDFKSEVRDLVRKLQSDEIKPYIELAEKYIDLLIEKGKEED